MQFKSLQSRMAVIFLTLILAIQLAGFLAIKYSINKNSRAAVNEQLEIGERVFLNLLKQNGDSLSQGAKILASDYGFRQAIASLDYETILSALSNHQSRIGADIAMFESSATGNLTISGKASHVEAGPIVEKLIQDGRQQGYAQSYAIFNHQPYQLVAVPVKAPLTIGWIIMGFQIDDTLAQNLHKLSNLDVTFISRSNGSDWNSMASTLGASLTEKLLEKASADRLTELSMGNTDYGTRYVSIMEHGDEALVAILQRSIDEATAPYLVLQRNLLLLTMLGALVFACVIFYVSKRISQPITELADTARKLQEGNFAIPLSSNREDELGKLSRAFGSMVDAIASREQSITRLAYWDELTGLPNRASFLHELGLALNQAAEQHEHLAVLVMNLNHFKQINKVLGHSAADALLRGVAQRLQSSIRQESDLVARLGGDEFALLLPRTGIENATHVANMLLKKLELPISIADQSVDISMGIGIACYPEHASTQEKLLGNAEMAMHVAKAKQSGAVLFDPAFDISSQGNLSLASELRQAIATNELALYVQPKIDLQNGKISAVEALIRWRHPQKGLMFPDQFIPFAEQSGLISLISLWMLAEAARVEMTWRKLGINAPMAVNLSTRDLIDQDLPHKILTLHQDAGLVLGGITLEITESSMMDDPQRAQQTLERLSDMGLQLSIDDFGTGYSSLAYLKRLPVSELKIDKSFVMKMEEDESDRKIVRSTIDLGHNLNLKVVAEGIESQAVWDLLASMGCDFGQGYHISKPMPAAEFPAWLQRWQARDLANT
jgi:diguanylate cyclase